MPDKFNIDTEAWRPAGEAEQWNPDAFQFKWNKDYTSFQLIPLRWTDDASYARYQGDYDDTTPDNDVDFGGVPTRGFVVQEHWMNEILALAKDWELRGSKTNIRETVALIQSGTGLIVGTVRISDSIGPLSKMELLTTIERHRVPAEDVPKITYANTHAWVLEDARRLKEPVQYQHPSGAVIWVKLEEETRVRLASSMSRGYADPADLNQGIEGKERRQNFIK